jgi:hypothetical protein
VPPIEQDIIVTTQDQNGKQIIGLVKLGKMIKLINILKEAKQSIEDFAGTRLKGAEKIADTTLKSGGLSLLTYKHYKVKLPYYKKASAGKLDKEAAKKEFEETLKSISLGMTQSQFQTEMGRLEVLGELLIENK